MNKIVKELYKYQDLKYQEFNSKLIPNIDNSKIIDVKIVDAKTWSLEGEVNDK